MQEIPKEVEVFAAKLQEAGFEAYVVGGCVRDLFIGRDPEDWDVTTNATPQEIQNVFPDSFYENKFFTVTVATESENPKLKEVEITTFRAELGYRDRRRPEEVTHAKTIEEDLSRRDFTVNAIAIRLVSGKRSKEEIVDPFEGQKDLKAKLIRAVGRPQARFNEDALRMMRAARIATVLDFTIEEETKKAIQQNADLLKEISKERVRDEFEKIVMADKAREGIELLYELKLLRHIVPELQEGYGVTQNKHHIYTVWEHNLFTLEYAAKKRWDSDVRIASLLHDVAKPRVKQGEGRDSTFYNHEVVGAAMAERILERLKFPRKQIEKIAKLIRYHMFYYNVGEVTESSVRKLVSRVGLDDMPDLLKVRMADRIGSGTPKAEPYKLRHWQYLIEKVSRDPISPKMLKANGNDIMKTLKIPAGPKVGQIVAVLLAEVLDDPKKNTKECLAGRMKELGKLREAELAALAQKAGKEVDIVETEEDESIKQKYFVK